MNTQTTQRAPVEQLTVDQGEHTNNTAGPGRAGHSRSAVAHVQAVSTENSRPPSSLFEEAENSMCIATLDTDTVARQEVVTESVCSTEDSGLTRVAGGANMNVDYARHVDSVGDPTDSRALSHSTRRV